MVIRRLGLHKYGLYSIKTGKRLGLFHSKAAALVRERQINYFKHLSVSGSQGTRRRL